MALAKAEAATAVKGNPRGLFKFFFRIYISSKTKSALIKGKLAALFAVTNLSLRYIVNMLRMVPVRAPARIAVRISFLPSGEKMGYLTLSLEISVILLPGVGFTARAGVHMPILMPAVSRAHNKKRVDLF